MSFVGRGAIDCDVHPSVPNLRALFPYLEDHWIDSIIQRGMDDLETISYPAGAPITARTDWRQQGGKPCAKLEQLREQALTPWGLSHAICNPLYGVHLLFSEDMAASFARAVNEWILREWLDHEPRLRASIVVPMQNVELSVEEIEYRATDRRFVQVLVMVNGDMPLGRRQYWPVYAAAERHGLPIGVHAGSSYRHPVTPVGWPSYYMEDYAAQAVAFQSQLSSLICEGVFQKFHELKFVFLESGFAWLPGYLWRLTKFWRSLRMEIPWVDREPGEIVRERVRFALQPMDAPTEPGAFRRLMQHLDSDQLLLFSSDYPHWQFDGDAALPQGLSAAQTQRILIHNPRETYPRLMEHVT
jgi:predicted TIM-barrel fold metal-dependent hydrolase